MLRFLTLFTAIALAGCASEHKLAICNGPLVALNAGHWQPTSQDMTAFDKMCPPTEEN